jgi:tetratricopeptide (TPR) repeat protein
LACGLQKEARHEEAVEAFREAIRLEGSGTADFFHNYAVSLEALRHFEESADAYQRAAQLNPSDADAWGNLGAVLAGLGRWKDAVPCQERALRLAPSATHALNLASTLYELNRLDEAERVLRDAVLLDPRSADVKEMLATVLAGQYRYDEAIKIARDTCESNSDAPSSQAVLAGVLAEASRLGGSSPLRTRGRILRRNPSAAASSEARSARAPQRPSERSAACWCRCRDRERRSIQAARANGR